jgi:trimeric autotransporter adhesin
MFSGRKLPITLAFVVLLGLAFGASCKGFFVKPTLSSIAVGPTTPTIDEGNTNNTVQMFAVGTFSDGSTGNPPVTWSSGTTSVATVSNSGLVTSVSTGTSTITATAVQNPAITGTQTVTVTVACIQSIAIKPTVGNINGAGNTFSFTASAVTCNGTVDITNIANWSSSQTGVATVAAGVVTAVADGMTTISASSGGVNSSNDPVVTVTGAP